MAAPNAVTRTWTLSQTATDIVSVSRGMLEAATTDNVSMLALLACEAFGSLLPMSIETKAKMHQACSQDHQSAVLKFLKAQIGYKRGDSGWQLARSDSGLRFLGLATCLLSTDLWISSELLRELVTETAQDKILIPTSQQLKALLLVLRYRLATTGFVNEVLGWNLLLNSNLNGEHLDPKCPSNEAIKKLINCMSSLARVGNATGPQVLKVKIPHRQAAWTIAFTKWCLGTPPTVIGEDGPVIVSTESSQVEVYPFTDNRYDNVEIAIWVELNSVRDLFQGLKDGLDDVQGMVSAQSYVETLSQRFGPKDSPYYLNAMQLVPYVCYEVYNHLGTSSSCRSQYQEISNLNDIDRRLSEQGVGATFGSVFPDEETILDTLRKYRSEGSETGFKRVPDGSTVSELPSALSIRQLLRESCPCVNCLATTTSHRRRCEFEKWLLKISRYVGTIFLLSMIIPVDSTGVLLSYNSSNLSLETKFTSTIYQCLTDKGRIGHYSVDHVIEALLGLVGHEYRDLGTTNQWIASSYLGQTLYPQLLQSQHIQPRGLLTVMCVPGIMTRSNVDYNLVKTAAIHMYGDDESDEGNPIPLPQLTPPVTVQDEHPFPNLSWRVLEQEKSLKLSLVARNLSSLPMRNPLRGLWTMTESIFVSCPHDEHSSCSDEHLLRAGPLDNGRNITDGAVGVINTYRNEAMRYFTLCSPVSYVVRDQACLNCCVLVSRLVQMPLVLC